MEKRWNLVYFFDGTCNDRDKDETKDWSNIVRLHDSIPKEAPDGTVQWKFYGDGVGTRVDEAVLGSTGGVGLEKRVQESYLHLGSVLRKARREHAEVGIYVFGFSRGAYAARWFAALLDFCGVPSNGVSYHEIDGFFKRLDLDAVEKAKRAGKLSPLAKIDMLGLFDTVQTTLFKGDFDVHVLPGIVRKCYHALAYNERRALFPVERFNASPGRLEEVWFLGSHSDVGGGYVERGLADLSLAWMIENARGNGLFVDDGPLPGDTAKHVEQFHDSLSFGWACADVVKTFRLWWDRRFVEGDVFHWSARGLGELFASVKPALPSENQIAYLDVPRGDASVA